MMWVVQQYGQHTGCSNNNCCCQKQFAFFSGMKKSKDDRIRQQKRHFNASVTEFHKPIVLLKNFRRFCQLLHLLVLPIFVARFSLKVVMFFMSFSVWHPKNVANWLANSNTTTSRLGRPSSSIWWIRSTVIFCYIHIQIRLKSWGTFFRLLTQLELIETRELQSSQLGLELALFVHFRDDRLQLRDLPEMPIPIPEEFQPWQVFKKTYFFWIFISHECKSSLLALPGMFWCKETQI